MHFPNGKMPASMLVVHVLDQGNVFRRLTPAECTASIVVDNDCVDPQTVHQRHAYMAQVHHGKQVLRQDHFGGIIKLSPHCPGFHGSTQFGILEEMSEAVTILGATVIGVSCHGEHCRLCEQRGITVAQRIFLTVDARRVLKSAADAQGWMAARQIKFEDMLPTDLGVYCTYHRRYTKDDRECQKTRVIDHSHPLFREIPITEVMKMTDLDVVRHCAPHLVEMAEV